MKISGESLQKLAKGRPEVLAMTFAKMLRDFGYPSLTAEYVQKVIGDYEPGKTPAGIIEMFVFGWLEDGI